MSRISSSLPNLLGGISQQDASVRLPNQVEDSVNMSSDVAEGLSTRQGSIFVDELAIPETVSGEHAFHFYRRDLNEKYLLAFNSTGGTYAYDLINEQEVLVVDDTDTFFAPSYLTCDNPAQEIKASTIGDSTFVVNTTKVVEMLPGLSPEPAAKGLVFISRGVAGISYNVIIRRASGLTHTATYNVPAVTAGLSTVYSTEDIATILKNTIDAFADISASLLASNKNTILIEDGLPSNPIISITTSDSYGDQGMWACYRTVVGKDKLPPVGSPGIVVKIKETVADQEYSYFVHWVEEASSGDGTYDTNGYWEETIGWEQESTLGSTTIPLEFKRLQDDDGSVTGTIGDIYFSIQSSEWESRKVGDDSSCPKPSFVDNTISDIFYHKNRIGVLSGENVILSRTGDLKNFWVESARTLSDTDPIDVAAGTTNVNNLRNAIPFQGSLLIIGENNQFQMSSNGALTPASVSLDSTTAHIAENTKPIGVGSSVYFPVKEGAYSTLREYKIDQLTVTNKALDVTPQVPRLIYGDVRAMTGSSAYDMLALMTGLDDIYIHQWYEDENLQKKQAAWNKWNFVSPVLTGAILDSDFWLVTKNDLTGAFNLQKISLSREPFGDMSYYPSLDLIDEPISQVYDSTTGSTTITFADHRRSADDMPTVLFSEPFIDQGLIAGDNLSNISWNGDYTVGTVMGDYSGASLIYGYPINASITFSTIYVREGDGSKAILDGKLQLLHGRMAFSRSGDFSITVDTTARGGNKYSYDNGGILGSSDFLYGHPAIRSGVIQFAIFCPNTTALIKMEANKFFPVTLQKFEWTGNFTLNTRRM